jgi:hypothetical protein
MRCGCEGFPWGEGWLEVERVLSGAVLELCLLYSGGERSVQVYEAVIKNVGASAYNLKVEKREKRERERKRTEEVEKLGRAIGRIHRRNRDPALKGSVKRSRSRSS